MVALSVLTLVISGQNAGPTNQLEMLICKIINLVEMILGVLVVIFFLVGAILFAVSHMHTNAGQHRSSMQGWALGLLVAGVAMLVLYIFAVPIVTFIASFGNLPIAQNPNVCSGVYF